MVLCILGVYDMWLIGVKMLRNFEDRVFRRCQKLRATHQCRFPWLVELSFLRYIYTQNSDIPSTRIKCQV
jgi:hypothetical protein